MADARRRQTAAETITEAPLGLPKDRYEMDQPSPLPTEQVYLDWIRRFIHFHGQRHPPGVETYLSRLERTSDWSLAADEHRPMTAMEPNALCPQVADFGPRRPRVEGLIPALRRRETR